MEKELANAISRISSVDAILDALKGLTQEEQRAALLEARARLEINSVPPPARVSGTRSAVSLGDVVLKILSDAPSGGFTAAEVARRAKGCNPASIHSTISTMYNEGSLNRFGERGSFSYTAKTLTR